MRKEAVAVASFIAILFLLSVVAVRLINITEENLITIAPTATPAPPTPTVDVVTKTQQVVRSGEKEARYTIAEYTEVPFPSCADNGDTFRCEYMGENGERVLKDFPKLGNGRSESRYQRTHDTYCHVVYSHDTIVEHYVRGHKIPYEGGYPCVWAPNINNKYYWFLRYDPATQTRYTDVYLIEKNGLKKLQSIPYAKDYYLPLFVTPDKKMYLVDINREDNAESVVFIDENGKVAKEIPLPEISDDVSYRVFDLVHKADGTVLVSVGPAKVPYVPTFVFDSGSDNPFEPVTRYNNTVFNIMGDVVTIDAYHPNAADLLINNQVAAHVSQPLKIFLEPDWSEMWIMSETGLLSIKWR